jgi:hypothetical protein
MCLVVVAASLTCFSYGEVRPEFSASLYGQLEDGEASLGLSTDSSLEWNYLTRNLSIDSSVSLYTSATTDANDDTTAQWQSENDLQYHISLLRMDALVGYSHVENEQLLDTDDLTSDQITLGFRKYLTRSARVTRSLSAEYEYTQQEADSEQTDSESASAVYTASRNLNNNANLYHTVQYSDYLNSTYAVAVTQGYVKSFRSSVLTAELGGNYADNNDADSITYTGNLNWIITANERLQYWFDASKYRTQASGLSYSEIFTSEYDADDLVDAESLSAGLTLALVPDRLSMDLSYIYSWLEETFEIQDSETETVSETDYGLLKLNYQLSRHSQLTVSTAFSFNEDEVGIIGDIEYDRTLNRNFYLFAAINDISNEDESIKYIAGITYRLPGVD